MPMEILVCSSKSPDIPEGSLEGDDYDRRVEKTISLLRGRDLQIEVDWRPISACAGSGGGIKLEIVDFFGKMHAEDYLDGEAIWGTIFSGNIWLK